MTIDEEWKEYWQDYCKFNPEADGADYADEYEAFFEGKMGEFRREGANK